MREGERRREKLGERKKMEDKGREGERGRKTRREVQEREDQGRYVRERIETGKGR